VLLYSSASSALCKCAVILELKELSAIRLSPELLLALEACLLNIYSMLRPIPGDYEQRAVLIRAFNLLAKDALGKTSHVLIFYRLHFCRKL